ncbi:MULTISPECIES: ParB family protein [Micrococcales]|jgi:hypothetical protein|uniref:Uncharacterized protein n=1 Tax=Arthrobacter ulcerisalmonis TaxID=2483813 RepID=A0A3P5XQU1_9MICC|nr:MULTISPECIES: hypothetical protein [Micrococcales]VDC33260.1 hypothetical protein PSET11_03289 [Arthrobacter ulcerisalmonis]
MNRPAPRKSSLSSASPFDHPTAPEASQEAPAAAPASTAPAPAAKSVTEPLSAAEKGEKPGKPPKITIYQHPDDSARMRGAIVAYMRNVGMTNLSKFANEAIMEKVERLEAQYNGGEPFEPVGPGVLTVGRPMGE